LNWKDLKLKPYRNGRQSEETWFRFGGLSLGFIKSVQKEIIF